MARSVHAGNMPDDRERGKLGGGECGNLPQIRADWEELAEMESCQLSALSFQPELRRVDTVHGHRASAMGGLFASAPARSCTARGEGHSLPGGRVRGLCSSAPGQQHEEGSGADAAGGYNGEGRRS
jgi:hypothetical protein